MVSAYSLVSYVPVAFALSLFDFLFIRKKAKKYPYHHATLHSP